MSGHMLEALCGCGYHRRFSVDYFGNMVVARSTDGSLVSTSRKAADLDGDAVIENPFAVHQSIRALVEAAPAKAGQCPECRGQNLELHFRGLWD